MTRRAPRRLARLCARAATAAVRRVRMRRRRRSASRTTAVRIAYEWPSETSAARWTDSGRTARTRKIIVAPRTATGRKDLATVAGDLWAAGRACAARPGTTARAAKSMAMPEARAMRGSQVLVTFRPSARPPGPLKHLRAGLLHVFTRLD